MQNIPTISQLFNNVLSNLEAEFSVTLNPFGKTFLVALAGVWAGLLWLAYTAVGLVQKNIWYDTADSVANGGTLERFGVSILGRWPFAAQPGTYTLTVTGTIGGVIPATAVFKSDDSSESPGNLYQITGAYTMPGSTGTITVVGLAGGLSTRLAIGDTLSATSPIANVNSVATVDAEVEAPVNAETLEVYRQNIGIKVQLTPGGWSAIDYRILGTTISGIKQTYAYARSGYPNEVNVWLQGPTPGVPVPTSPVIDDYKAALDLVLPLSVYQANVASSPINDIDVTIIMGSFTPFTPSQKALIESSLTDFVNGVHPFIASCDTVSSRNDVIATFNLNAAISSAVPGYGFSGVTFTVNGTPSVNWIAGDSLTGTQGYIPFLNSITYA